MAQVLLDIIVDLVIESLDDDDLVQLVHRVNDAVDEKAFTFRLGDLMDTLRDGFESDEDVEDDLDLLDREDAEPA